MYSVLSKCAHLLNLILRNPHRRWNWQLVSQHFCLSEPTRAVTQILTQELVGHGGRIGRISMSDGIGPTLFMFQVEQKNLSYICADCPELVTVDPEGQLPEINAQQCSLGLGFGVWFWLLLWLLPGFFGLLNSETASQTVWQLFERLHILLLNAFSG